jgi:hypothetical protein
MLSVSPIVPEAFCSGVAIALVFGIFVVLEQSQHWVAKLIPKKPKLIRVLRRYIKNFMKQQLKAKGIEVQLGIAIFLFIVVITLLID